MTLTKHFMLTLDSLREIVLSKTTAILINYTDDTTIVAFGQQHALAKYAKSDVTAMVYWTSTLIKLRELDHVSLTNRPQVLHSHRKKVYLFHNMITAV